MFNVRPPKAGASISRGQAFWPREALTIMPEEIRHCFNTRHALSGAGLAWLMRQGVALFDCEMGDGVHDATIRPSGSYFDTSFRGDEEGEGALIFLCRDLEGEPEDMLAWNPRSDARYRWLGRAALLGAQNVTEPRYLGATLPVWRTPLGWLKSGRRGVVILDAVKAAGHLADCGSLGAEDAAHARDLARLLARPAPRILVGDAA
ncbi:hypothetical protein GCM10007874_65480 [Labrys miyagiensis]|uniref:Uncharacterized protein n=1 Tax=Labrys miyagiensis TaxID=346912 RepID=A0ABQ6CV98_9HYPH|nr:hypothetical protein [Labrys miyagiensis]GLS23527.1 hypothetical protein GCM10007874_65480 [Labrys miyagiensis]